MLPMLLALAHVVHVTPADAEMQPPLSCNTRYFYLYLTPCIYICHPSFPKDAFMLIIFVGALDAARRAPSSYRDRAHTGDEQDKSMKQGQP